VLRDEAGPQEVTEKRRTNERAHGTLFFKPLSVVHPRPERLVSVVLGKLIAGDSFHRGRHSSDRLTGSSISTIRPGSAFRADIRPL
jgi:hypothetical protein